jgi:two-component system, OmpR family, sensor kinase
MIKSLRTRLLCGLGVLIIMSCVGAGVWEFRRSFHEAIELQDAILLQIGFIAIRNHALNDFTPQPSIDTEARVVVRQIPDRSAPTESGNGFPSLPTDLQDGLHTLPGSDGFWRVLVRTRRDGSRVAIGQSTTARNEIARDSAIRAVLPMLALIPCLIVVVAGVIHYSFRPVIDLAKKLDADETEHPLPIPVESAPSELQPFITSINRLLDRMAVLLDHRRRFVALSAHELRTPITAISIQAENVDIGQLPQEARNRLQALKEGVRRTVRLLEQLLTLSKYDYGKAPPSSAVALDGIVKAVVADFTVPASAQDIDLGCVRIEAGVVTGDSTALTIMVRNLVDNAVRYTPRDGQINLSVYRDCDSVILLVEDTGSGIEPGDLEVVFEPFNRGRLAKGGGTGLGLSIVRRIVESHGGTISMQNRAPPETSGLLVTVRLPAAPAHHMASRATANDKC